MISPSPSSGGSSFLLRGRHHAAIRAMTAERTSRGEHPPFHPFEKCSLCTYYVCGTSIVLCGILRNLRRDSEERTWNRQTIGFDSGSKICQCDCRLSLGCLVCREDKQARPWLCGLLWGPEEGWRVPGAHCFLLYVPAALSLSLCIHSQCI